jgi:hypothetical protein
MVRIFFNDLRIDQISNSSGVFSGRNMQTKWKHSKKINEGFGSLSGDKNITAGNRNVILDPDFIDVFVRRPVMKQSNLE